MDQVDIITQGQEAVPKQPSKVWLYASAKSKQQKRKSNMSKENTDLATHVELCAMRYKGIEEKFDAVEQRLNKIETDVNKLSNQIQSNFLEIKLALEQANSRRDVQVIATMGTLAVAIISAVGYWLAKH
jgi:predicted  nucleic acid-binding Zn-ribbon protein